MKKTMKIATVIAMLSVPAFVHFGVIFRVQRLELYSDSYNLVKNLIAWHGPLLKGLLQDFWPNVLFYASPHISILILAIVLRLRFILTVRALVVINFVLICFSFWIYGRAHVPDSPLMWIYYLPVEAACIAIFLMSTRLLTQKAIANPNQAARPGR